MEKIILIEPRARHHGIAAKKSNRLLKGYVELQRISLSGRSQGCLAMIPIDTFEIEQYPTTPWWGKTKNPCPEVNLQELVNKNIDTLKGLIK